MKRQKKTGNNTQIHVIVSKEDKARLQAYSFYYNQSVSSIVASLIQDYLDQNNDSSIELQSLIKASLNRINRDE